MNLGVILKGLLRRWYILLAGLLLAIGASAGVWLTVPGQYELTSTQLLLPGRSSLPPDSENPLLYIGGLGLAADVVVRATGSQNMVKEIGEQHPGATFEVSRDPTTPGPVILITVRAPNDDEAGVVLDRLMEQTVAVLAELQEKENIPESYRITVITTTRTEQGVPRDRTRLILSGAVGVAMAGASVLLAALVEGIAVRQRAKRVVRERGRHAVESGPQPKGEPISDVAAGSPDPSAEGVVDEQESPKDVVAGGPKSFDEEATVTQEQPESPATLADNQQNL